MKPVSAQCKFDTEKDWGVCSVEHHNLVQSEPHKWPQYNTRLLYSKEEIDEFVENMRRRVIASILITDIVLEERGIKPTSEDYIKAIEFDFGDDK